MNLVDRCIILLFTGAPMIGNESMKKSTGLLGNTMLHPLLLELC